MFLQLTLKGYLLKKKKKERRKKEMCLHMHITALSWTNMYKAYQFSY